MTMNGARRLLFWPYVPFFHLAFSGLFLLPLHAQAPPSLEPGRRIKVTAESLRHWETVGTFIEESHGGLLLTTDNLNSSILLPLESIIRIRVEVGKGTAIWRGAFLGSVVGIIAGVVLDESQTDWRLERMPDWNLSRQIAFSISGGLLGGLIGRLIETPKWIDVHPPVPAEQRRSDSVNPWRPTSRDPRNYP